MSLALLYERDLKRLAQEIAGYSLETLLWVTVPGISNSAGHLVLHLEGNLRELIGRQLGAVAYTRDRPQEFSGPHVSQAELMDRIQSVADLIMPVLIGLTPAQLDAAYPQDFLGQPVSTRAMLIHLYGHLNWHLGQIDYLRRVLSASGAIALASL